MLYSRSLPGARGGAVEPSKLLKLSVQHYRRKIVVEREEWFDRSNRAGLTGAQVFGVHRASEILLSGLEERAYTVLQPVRHRPKRCHTGSAS